MGQLSFGTIIYVKNSKLFGSICYIFFLLAQSLKLCVVSSHWIHGSRKGKNYLTPLIQAPVKEGQVDLCEFQATLD